MKHKDRRAQSCIGVDPVLETLLSEGIENVLSVQTKRAAQCVPSEVAKPIVVESWFYISETKHTVHGLETPQLDDAHSPPYDTIMTRAPLIRHKIRGNMNMNNSTNEKHLQVFSQVYKYDVIDLKKLGALRARATLCLANFSTRWRCVSAAKMSEQRCRPNAWNHDIIQAKVT